LLLFIHQIQNQKPISFPSFSTNAKETEKERDPFFFLFIAGQEEESLPSLMGFCQEPACIDVEKQGEEEDVPTALKWRQAGNHKIIVCFNNFKLKTTAF